MLEKECDEVLETLKVPPPRRISIVETWNIDLLHQALGTSYETLSDVLAILRTEQLIIEGHNTIIISDLGRILLLKGGFSWKAFEEYALKIQDDKMKKMEEEHRILSSKLDAFELVYKKRYLLLTKLIMIWTAIAALYYLLEVLRIQYHLGLPCHVPFP
jgi:hypothetical protein